MSTTPEISIDPITSHNTTDEHKIGDDVFAVLTVIHKDYASENQAFPTAIEHAQLVVTCLEYVRTHKRKTCSHCNEKFHALPTLKTSSYLPMHMLMFDKNGKYQIACLPWRHCLRCEICKEHHRSETLMKGPNSKQRVCKACYDQEEKQLISIKKSVADKKALICEHCKRRYGVLTTTEGIPEQYTCMEWKNVSGKEVTYYKEGQHCIPCEQCSKYTPSLSIQTDLYGLDVCVKCLEKD